MRLLPCLAAAALFLGGNSFSVRAQDPDFEEAPVDFDEFAEVLEPHGRWIEVPDVGVCWQPRVNSSWAPYTRGHWAYTNAGWTWVSDEPFGGVVFHYGRWISTDRGWCWVPGQVWGPAWVSWRTSPDYIGWAPLPPEVPWQSSRGIGSWVDVQADIGPSYYRFCSVRNFGSTHIHQVVIPVSRNATVLIQTQNVTSIRSRDRWVFCDGPDYSWVNQRCAQPVVSLQLVLQPSVNAFISLGFSTGRTNVVSSNTLYLPAPARIRTPQVQNFNGPPPRSEIRLTRGWSTNSAGREMDRKVATHVSQEWERQRAFMPSPSASPSANLPRQGSSSPSAGSSDPSSGRSAPLQGAPTPLPALVPSGSLREPGPNSPPVSGNLPQTPPLSNGFKSDRPYSSGTNAVSKMPSVSQETDTPEAPRSPSPLQKTAPNLSSGFSYPSPPSSRNSEPPAGSMVPGPSRTPNPIVSSPKSSSSPTSSSRTQPGEPSLSSPPRGAGSSPSPGTLISPGKSSQPTSINTSPGNTIQRPASSSPFSRSPGSPGGDSPGSSMRSSSSFSPGNSPSFPSSRPSSSQVSPSYPGPNPSFGNPSGSRSFPSQPSSSPSMTPSSRSFPPASSPGFSSPSPRPAPSAPSTSSSSPRPSPSPSPAAAPSSSASGTSSSKKSSSSDSKKEDKK